MSKDPEQHLIDVLLPVYNGEATIAETLNSILAQSEPRFRVLVIDDGSSDATAQLVRGFARRDARIELIEKANSGLVDTLNLGLGRTRAPFIARHDSDDISYPDRFAHQLARLEREPGAVAVAGACIHIDAQGAPTGTRYDPPDPATADPWALPASEPYLLHPFLMLRRDALMRLGGYRHVCHAEDTDLYWRLREVGRLINLREDMGKMRLHGASVSNASPLNGRIMAIHSQLAAISARRRAHGEPDLTFAPGRLAAFKAARAFATMLALAGTQLSEPEREWLKLAASVKLLELASGRMYELEIEDCHTIRDVYLGLSHAQLRGRCIGNWAYRTTLIRLVRKGLLARAGALFHAPLAVRVALLRLL